MSTARHALTKLLKPAGEWMPKQAGALLQSVWFNASQVNLG